jgi:hypothetical protein
MTAIASLRPAHRATARRAQQPCEAAPQTATRAPLTLDRLIALVERARAGVIVSAAVDGSTGAVRLELEAPAGSEARDAISNRVGAVLLGSGEVSRLSLGFVRLDAIRGWVPSSN